MVDPNDTESYNLVWTVTVDELWAAIEAGEETITKSGQYKYGSNVIPVTFTAEITQPTANLSGMILENYWDDDFTYIKHNVAVPDLGAEDPALCTYENNINNAFKSTGEALLDLAFANPDYAGYTYEYVFDVTENQPVKKVDGITISVSDDGKTLSATKDGVTEDVATINPQAANVGDILQYAETDLAKYLLNKGPEFMKARIMLNVMNECGKPMKVTGFGVNGGFNVHFLRPVNIEGAAADNFVDAVDFGAKGSYIDIKKVVQLSDWRNYAKNVETYNFDPNNLNYYDYYDVQAITIDKANIVPSGLIVSGKELTELPVTIEVNQEIGTAQYPLDEYPFGVLTYKNNGANLIDPFTLIVPVTVEYKWGKVETKVKVAVQPTSATKSAKK